MGVHDHHSCSVMLSKYCLSPIMSVQASAIVFVSDIPLCTTSQEGVQ